MAEFEAWNQALAPRRAARMDENGRCLRLFGRSALPKGRFPHVLEGVLHALDV